MILYGKQKSPHIGVAKDLYIFKHLFLFFMDIDVYIFLGDI